MLLDLTNLYITLDQDSYPGEVVFRVISKNPLEEPPMVLATPTDNGEDDDGDIYRTTPDGSAFPYTGEAEDAPPTTTVHLYRLPLTQQDYLVVSWNPASDAYYGYGICITRLDGKMCACVLNEDDLNLNDSGESYLSLKGDIYDNFPNGAWDRACLRVPLP